MPWQVNAAIVAWFVMMGLVSRFPFFYHCALGWTVGYLLYLGIS